MWYHTEDKKWFWSLKSVCIYSAIIFCFLLFYLRTTNSNMDNARTTRRSFASRSKGYVHARCAYLDKFAFISDFSHASLWKVKHVYKMTSSFRWFENKFYFIRNTKNRRGFANTWLSVILEKQSISFLFSHLRLSIERHDGKALTTVRLRLFRAATKA